MGMTIIIALVTFVVGGLLVWFVMRVLMKSRYDAVIREAEKESEVMKQKKLLEVKEKFLHLKADLEKQVSARNSKIQSVEAKLKQRELNLNQRQEDLRCSSRLWQCTCSPALMSRAARPMCSPYLTMGWPLAMSQAASL